MEAQNPEYILVTGGVGYIGSHTVVELIAEDKHVLIVDNLENSNIKCLERINTITGKPDLIKYFNIDIKDTAALEEQVFTKFKITSVIHFAAYKAVGESVRKPLDYYQNNVSATIGLLQLMVKYSVHCFIFSSSACVYGDNASCLETDTIQPINPYGQNKAMIEQVMKDLSFANKDFTTIALRYFNPIGAHPSGLIGESPLDIPNNLMPYVMRVATGHFPKLSVFGNDYDTVDGTGVRDYIHVVDLAKGHTAALAKQATLSGYNAFNLGTGNGTSVLQLVAAFEKAYGKPIPYEISARRPGDAATSLAVPDKANNELGWKTEFGIEEMCRDTWNWASKNPNGYEEAKPSE